MTYSAPIECGLSKAAVDSVAASVAEHLSYGNLEPAFSRVPEHHKERLDSLRNYWESERTKREVERESLSQKEDDAGARGTSPAAEELEAWLAEHLTKHDGKSIGEEG